ncbi:MAG TPA: helix-turn-helix domain-containing protein [Gemmatimonadaceae bacterium]|nr:helix-turn-helix domain-containing protein [Gemmatimonadaceae bacterium]
MRAADFLEHAARGSELPRRLNRYTQALLVQIAQASACNRMHSVRHRCARWLLMTQDRMNADSFLLTQQFLSQMLGVQRTTVSEAEACECYAIIRAEYDRLMRNQPVPSVIKLRELRLLAAALRGSRQHVRHRLIV